MCSDRLEVNIEYKYMRKEGLAPAYDVMLDKLKSAVIVPFCAHSLVDTCGGKYDLCGGGRMETSEDFLYAFFIALGMALKPLFNGRSRPASRGTNLDDLHFLFSSGEIPTHRRR